MTTTRSSEEEEKLETKRKREDSSHDSVDSEGDVDEDEDDDMEEDSHSHALTGGAAMKEEEEPQRFYQLIDPFYWICLDPPPPPPDDLPPAPSDDDYFFTPSPTGSPLLSYEPSPLKFPYPPGPDDIKFLDDFLEQNIYISPDHQDAERLDDIYHSVDSDVRYQLDEKRFRKLRLAIRDRSLDVQEELDEKRFRKLRLPIRDRDRSLDVQEGLDVREVRRRIDENQGFEMWKHDKYKDLMIADIGPLSPYSLCSDPYSYLEVFVDPVNGFRYRSTYISQKAMSTSRKIDEQRVEIYLKMDREFPRVPTTMEEDKQVLQQALELVKHNDFNLIGHYEVAQCVKDHALEVNRKIVLKNAQAFLKKYVSELRQDKRTSIDVKKLVEFGRAYYIYYLHADNIKVFIDDLLSRDDANADEKIDDYLERISEKERKFTVTDYLISKVAVADLLGLEAKTLEDDTAQGKINSHGQS